MSTDNTFKMYVNPTWSIISNIRKKISELLEYNKIDNKELLDATTMVSSELMENAVKYGEGTTEDSMIEFEISVEKNKINISVSNHVNAGSNIDVLIDVIETIKKCDNPGELYVNRLNELLENPKHGESRLGLYRIAYEGEFNLDYKFSDNLLKVMAYRSV
jgi:hypothetical protein